MTALTDKLKINRIFAAALLVMLFSALFGSTASAQTTQTTTRTREREFAGAVTEMTPATMTIRIQTQLRTFNIQRAELQTGIAVGDLVRVHARLTTTGVWVAREVELSDPTIPSVDDQSGRGADDTAMDDRGGHGADDPAGDDHSSDSGGHGSDDSGQHGGGHGGDDGSGHR